MNNVDVLLLGVTVITTLYTIRSSKYNRRVLTILVVLLFTLALVQFLWKGFYWQYVPTYFLLSFLTLISCVKRASKRVFKLLQQAILSLLLLASVAPWAIFTPVPSLIRPQGTYSVGTQVFRWVDSARSEQITKESFDKRNVIVQAWYPAAPNATGTHSLYIDGLHTLPTKVGVAPSFLFEHYDQIDTYATSKAPLSNAQKKWPVVIFLTGYGAARAFYTSFVVNLASYGYVVLAIDHPYEAALTQLADGTLATTIENFQPGAPDRLDFMKNRLDIRVADVQFVLNQLEKKHSSTNTFFTSLDLNRIGIAGHSLGGATGAAAMAHDSRIKAAVNIDGTLYGGLPKSNGYRPFLLVESNKREPGRFVRYETGNQLLFNQFGGGHRYEIEDADHYSFTDVPLLLAPPARLLAGYLLKLGQIPIKTHTATVSLLNSFFDHTLNGKPSEIDAVANRYQGVVRKQVTY